MMMKRTIICVLMLIILATPLNAEEGLVRVVKIIDGDSLLLEGGLEVRLIGVDTPEHEDPIRNRRNAKRAGIPYIEYTRYSKKAKQYVQELIGGRFVRLKFDKVNESIAHLDSHHRYLAYVLVPREAIAETNLRTSLLEDDHYNLAALIIAEGYGLAYLRFPFEYASTFRELEAQAKSHRRGLWQHQP